MSTATEHEAPVKPTVWQVFREYIPLKLIAVVVVIYLAIQGYQWISHSGDTTVTAHFVNADGLYKGDDVKVLGVSVGRVTDIHPETNDVRVTLQVNGDVKIPQGASAAIVSPSLVSGRFVQLAPAYTGGATMASGASIPVDRTAVPLSFDDVKSQLTQLSTALAPQSGTSQPLADTINALQANLKSGNADALRTAIEGLQTTATTLADGKGDLFSTISNLNSFTQNLAVNDAAVAGFTHQLSAVSGVLAANRTQLTQAISSLTQALGSTGNFLTTNRDRINQSIADLNLLSAALADRSNQLAGVLHAAPTVITDFYNIIENQAITGRASLTGLTDAPSLICGAILGVGGTAQQCKDALQSLINLQATTSALAKARASGTMGNLINSGGLLTGTLSGLNNLLPGLLGTTLGGLGR